MHPLDLEIALPLFARQCVLVASRELFEVQRFEIIPPLPILHVPVMVETEKILPVLAFDIVAPRSPVQALGLLQRHVLQVGVPLRFEALRDHDQVYQPRGAQVAPPVLVGAALVQLAPDLQSAACLVIVCFEEAVDPDVNVLLGSVLDPQARPRVICDPDAVVDCGLDQVEALPYACNVVPLDGSIRTRAHCVAGSYNMAFLDLAAQPDFKQAAGANDSDRQHLFQPAALRCMVCNLLHAKDPLDNFVDTNLEQEIDLEVNNEMSFVNADPEFGAPFQVLQKRMLVLKALSPQVGDLSSFQPGS